MPYEMDDRTAQDLIALEPWTAERHKAPVPVALRHLVDSERARRGYPDEKTGALNTLFLTQGTLLKEEFDLGTHAHHEGWTLGAIVADVRELITFNLHHGFPQGDVLLREVAQAMTTTLPGARIVRVQGDAFAALLVPTSQLQLTEDRLQDLRSALASAARRGTPEGVPPPAFTVAALSLTIHAPSHWQLLGPLVWAELERAYLLERRGQATGIQQRHIHLDGFFPVPDAR